MRTLKRSLQEKVFFQAGYSHAVFISKTGTFAMGKWENGALGVGTKKKAKKPRKVIDDGEIFLTISSHLSWNHTFYYGQSGSLFTAGSSTYGQLGMGKDIVECLKPTRIAFFDDKEIFLFLAGADYSYVNTDKGLFVFGEACDGQLGLGESVRDNTYEPRLLDLSKIFQKNEFIVKMSGGNYHVLLLTNLGNVYSTGRGDNGRLGNGDCKKKFNFSRIENINVKSKELHGNYIKKKFHDTFDISCGSQHSLFVDKYGDVFTCGLNSNGELGHGNTKSNYFVPTLVNSLKKEKIFLCEGTTSSSCFITRGGRFFFCGGQLSFLNSTQQVSIPIEFQLEGHQMVAYRGGNGSHYLITKTGKCFVSGANSNNELGVEKNSCDSIIELKGYTILFDSSGGSEFGEKIFKIKSNFCDVSVRSVKY